MYHTLWCLNNHTRSRKIGKSSGYGFKFCPQGFMSKQTNFSNSSGYECDTKPSRYLKLACCQEFAVHESWPGPSFQKQAFSENSENWAACWQVLSRDPTSLWPLLLSLKEPSDTPLHFIIHTIDVGQILVRYSLLLWSVCQSWKGLRGSEDTL